ncbi:MAG: hypothetical protein NXI01_02085 [Gammaproteobacteria bacterium]|nr:hypothetical protein [Gammaproteobacteria bacterium]
MTIFHHVSDYYVPVDPSESDLADFNELNAVLAGVHDEITTIEIDLREKEAKLRRLNETQDIMISGLLLNGCKAKEDISAEDMDGRNFNQVANVIATAKEGKFVSLNDITHIITIIDNAVREGEELGKAPWVDWDKIRTAVTTLQEGNGKHSMQMASNLSALIAALQSQIKNISNSKTKMLSEKESIKNRWKTTLTRTFESAIQTLLPIDGAEFQDETSTVTAISNLGRRFLACVQNSDRTEPTETSFNNLVNLSKKHPIPADLQLQIRRIIRAHEYNLNKIREERLTEIVADLNPLQPEATPKTALSWMLLRPEFWKNVALSVLAIAAIILFAKGSVWGIAPVIAGAALFAGYKFFKPNTPAENHESLGLQPAASAK